MLFQQVVLLESSRPAESDSTSSSHRSLMQTASSLCKDNGYCWLKSTDYYQPSHLCHTRTNATFSISSLAGTWSSILALIRVTFTLLSYPCVCLCVVQSSLSKGSWLSVILDFSIFCFIFVVKAVRPSSALIQLVVVLRCGHSILSFAEFTWFLFHPFFQLDMSHRMAG